MDAATIISALRRSSGLTLRALADRAGTSHSTLSAYEHGRTEPTTETFLRVLRAGGRLVTVHVEQHQLAGSGGRGTRAQELADVVDLADAFPNEFAPMLECPPVHLALAPVEVAGT